MLAWDHKKEVIRPEDESGSGADILKHGVRGPPKGLRSRGAYSSDWQKSPKSDHREPRTQFSAFRCIEKMTTSANAMAGVPLPSHAASLLRENSED